MNVALKINFHWRSAGYEPTAGW